MNDHETLIRQIAEESAIAKHPVSFQLYNKYKNEIGNGWSHDFYVKNWHFIVDEYIIPASITVKYMKYAFSAGYREGAEWGVGEHSHSKLEMLERDPIPPAETGKEAAGDEGANS
ncbi:MAG: hypothetical protein WB562_13675 [Candidatus Sulfotelmatobacter sp.]